MDTPMIKVLWTFMNSFCSKTLTIIMEDDIILKKGYLCPRMIRKPMANVSFFYFVISILLSFMFGVYYLTGSDSAYILAGTCGLITTCYGFNHFRSLAQLRTEIDLYASLNHKLKTQNKTLASDVLRLFIGRNELKDLHHKLKAINCKTKENNLKFQQLQQNLQYTTLNSVKGIQSVREMALKFSNHWHKKLLQRERSVIYRIYDRIEKDNNGISKDEFNQLAEIMPHGYKQRFNRLGTFDALAAGKSTIDIEDFVVAMDVFAEMNVNDCDIDFKIERIASEHHEAPFLRQISITKRSKSETKHMEFEDLM